MTGLELLPERVLSRPLVIIAAHPDDEVLSVGTLLPYFRNLRALVHVTDGAPRRGSDAANAGANSWQEYAALRRNEFQSAMKRAGVLTARLLCLDYPDQEASYNLVMLSRRLAALFQRIRPSVVFTHSYEGGHPDHDACAAAVRFACLLLDSQEKHPQVFEFASYHMAPDGGLESERFLPGSRRIWRHTLTEEERQRKRDLFDTYQSQQRVLSQFPLRAEPIRVAPKYNFCKPPHRGKLYYENFGWGMTGRIWRKLARQAMATLGLSHCV